MLNDSDAGYGVAIGLPIGIVTLLFFLCYGCRIRIFGWCLSRTCRVNSCCSRCFIPATLHMDLRNVMTPTSPHLTAPNNR
jgi:hypothetical protein